MDDEVPIPRRGRLFELDPVAYPPALSERGLASYRTQLDAVTARLGQRPDDRWGSPHSREWFVLDWNAQRLAVLDRDIEAIIATHARDRKVAAWFEDTAKAFEEIAEFDLAIDWAKQATDFDLGHQSLAAADYWCRLLEAHRPEEALGGRLLVFRRWPSATSADQLHRVAGDRWADYGDEVMATLCASPGDAVKFAMLSLRDLPLAWRLADSLALDDNTVWNELLTAYQKIDPVAVLPIHQRLVEDTLLNTGPRFYRLAGRRLATMRNLAAGTNQEATVAALIAGLREAHRRRPRLQQEFDRAGLP